MKITQYILPVLVGFFSLFSGWAGEVYRPETFTSERYRGIWEKRPFSPATPEATQAPQDGIEQQYALCGLVKLSDQWVAFVLNRKSLERMRVSMSAAEKGVQLVSVQEAANSKDATVVISAGGQTGTVRFDESLLNASAEKTAGKESKEKTAASPEGGKPPVIASMTTAPAINNSRVPSAAKTLRRNPVNLSP